MKRDPAERYIKQRMDSITVKRVRPLFLWYECKKCHKEFRREPMYHCSCQDDWFKYGIYNDYYGCTHCFPNKNNFLKWLQDNDILYTEESLKKLFKKRGIG